MKYAGVCFTLCHDGTSSDAVSNILETRIQVEHLGRRCLENLVSMVLSSSPNMTYLGVFATLEKRSHANKTDIIVPHDSVLDVISGGLENVLKDFF